MSTLRPPRQSIDSFQDRKWKEGVSRELGATLAGGMPANVPVITPTATPLASQHRVLTGSPNVSITDNGAGNSVVVDLMNTGVSAGTYENATVTVDEKGRVTSIEEGVASSGGGGSAGLYSLFMTMGG